MAEENTSVEPGLSEPKGKSNSVIITVWDKAKNELRFNVLKASETGGSLTLVLSLDKVSASNRAEAVIMGFKQRIGDAAAIPFNQRLKRYATPREKYDAMLRLVEHYNSGAEEWSPRRQATGGGVSGAELMLTQALSEAYPTWTVEAIRAKVVGMTAPERTSLCEHHKLRPIIERLRRAALEEAGVDADKLLAGFEDAGAEDGPVAGPGASPS